tara:strand:+ start:144 stop:386 length:243 start_codon:yes stop_codon:yes gene_type:complete
VNIINKISEINPKAKIVDGFDDAIIGICSRFGSEDVIAYDYNKCIEILMMDMSLEESLEYMEYNVVGSYVGEGTPVYIRK